MVRIQNMNRRYIHCWLRGIRKAKMLLTWWCTMILIAKGIQGEGLHPIAHTIATSIVCPSSCYCDDNGEYVSCVGDGHWRFPMDIPNTTLRLELRNYLVKGLNSQDFTTLTVLQELKLQQSRIETIENATFESNIKLERLDLSQNALISVDSAVLKDLQRLRFLDLSSNAIDFIEEAFMDLSNLEQLNMRDNKLPQLTTRTFVGLPKVQYLNLDTNNIASIEVGTFQYLTNLAHLIISNNPLTSLSRLDFFGSRLQYIDISNVGLDRVPQSLTKFVRDLRLAKNNLTHISAGDFDSYPYLGLLVLDDNCVSEIENDALGRQEYLMRLWLNGNCLTRVPRNLPPSLLALYMEENKLTELSSYSFKGLTHLEQLFLQRNEIRILAPCVFCDLVNLKSLDLQANQIEDLPSGIFSNLTQLETLDLSQNNLKMIDSRCFEGLTRLTALQMSRVPSTIQMDESTFDALQSLQILEVYDSSLLVQTIMNSTRMLHGLRRVQELNIMHNRIVKLRPDFPSFFPSLKVIKMSGNLWHCDQDIKWLSNWIKQSNVQFYSSYNIRCATPLNIQFKPLMMLSESDFEVSTTETQTVLSTTLMTSVKEHPMTTSSFSSFLISASTQSAMVVAALTETSSSLPTVTPLTQSISSTVVPLASKPISLSPYRYHIMNVTAEDQFTNSTLSSASGDELTKDISITANQSSDIPTAEQRLTSEDFHTTEVYVTDSVQEGVPSTVISQIELAAVRGNSVDSLSSIPQTVSPQRRVLSSRLRVATQVSDSNRWDHTTTIVVSTVIAVGCFVLVAGALTVFTVLRLRHRYQPVKHRNMRRSSSISYYPQKDEVSIVTLTEGTVGLRTNSHHGLGNKLYYIMESGSAMDTSKDTLPDSQLQELLPQQTTENTRVY